MKRKTLLICMAAVILQMCWFTGCSEDNSNATSVISQDSSEKSADINREPANSDAITNTDKEMILPEMEIEDNTSETKQNVSVQSDQADTANPDNKAVTSNNTSKEETTTTAASSESKTTVTTKGAIELPEIEFD